MFRRIHFTLLIVSFMSAMSAISFAQKDKDKGRKEAKEVLTGEAVLWREPTDITSRDLFLGSGGDEMKPDLSNVTFEKEEASGYSVKYTVHDGAGKKWVVKLGNEARPETTANRLL